jgi:4a-hydroxytetrahydrobiopterin dehydratase
MSDTLAAADLSTGLAALDNWSGDANAITRTAKLPTFLGAIGVVDRVAAVAEEFDHHPDIDIRWRTLTFTCSTHSAGGVTTKDLQLAARIDAIITDAS